MTPRQRQHREHREAAILQAARELAEREGWDAVTTRRLSEAIGYSQPVLYDHFPRGKSAIMDAVALLGADRMAKRISTDRGAARTARSMITRLVQSYLAFAAEEPAVYQAIFGRPTRLQFGADDSPEPLRRAFAEIVTSTAGAVGDRDPETYAEVVWSAMHGLATLTRDGRLRPAAARARVRLLVDELVDRRAGASADRC